MNTNGVLVVEDDAFTRSDLCANDRKYQNGSECFTHWFQS